MEIRMMFRTDEIVEVHKDSTTTVTPVIRRVNSKISCGNRVLAIRHTEAHTGFKRQHRTSNFGPAHWALEDHRTA
jgi:hypothetical protein